MSSSVHDPASLEVERSQMLDLIVRIVDECPDRKATSEAERRAQAIVREQLVRLGLEIEEQAFTFNDNQHANVALHAALAVCGSAVAGVAPGPALGLHLLAGCSFLLDGTHRAHVLRRLFRSRPSQNLLAALPAAGEPRLRVVLVAHADAAPTGWIFHPELLRRAQRWSGGAEGLRPMALFTQTMFLLAGCDLLRLVLGPLALPLRPIEGLLTLPSLLVLSASLGVLLRDRVVPGANDDLSGVAALPVLAARLTSSKPPDVELVFAVTGCEEAGLGGADALARRKRATWDPARTVVVALDSVGGGQLRYLDAQGDIVRRRSSRWLAGLADQVTASEPRFAGVTRFCPPLCETDAAAFMAHGYDAIALVCIDPATGAPANYHNPSDTPDRLDLDQLVMSVDFAEQLVRRLMSGAPGG